MILYDLLEKRLKLSFFFSLSFSFQNTPTSGNSLMHRPISATELRANARPVFGRKQFNNQGNVTANGAAKNLFGNYSQAHSTITSNGLAAIRKWW
jgi:hypothetical protein